MSELTSEQQAVLSHLRTFFAGHSVEVVQWPVGPVEQRLPGFRVARVSHGPKMPALTTYVSLGAWAAHGQREHGLEFLIIGPEDSRLAELVTMAAYYHAGASSQLLDHGHTVPVGEPWLTGSDCDHLLVCLPYPFGPDLETCVWEGGHARLLWLLPITEPERDFKFEFGLEALEARFDDAAIRFWEPQRKGVVTDDDLGI